MCVTSLQSHRKTSKANEKTNECQVSILQAMILSPLVHLHWQRRYAFVMQGRVANLFFVWMFSVGVDHIDDT